MCTLPCSELVHASSINNMLVSSLFVDLLGCLPALEVLRMTRRARFDATTQLPASWAGLARLRYLDIASVTFDGGLPAEWGNPGALPSLQKL